MISIMNDALSDRVIPGIFYEDIFYDNFSVNIMYENGDKKTPSLRT